jgi:lipopolysaccharide/colanic/teichoic acid biosynthesis glycosyltransferase
MLILGTGQLARSIVEEIEGRPEAPYAVIGVLDDVTNLGRVVDETRPHRIVVALAERRGRLPLCRLLESRARGIVVEDGVETLERLTGKIALETLSPSSLIFSRDFALCRRQQALARTLSVVLSAVGLVFLAPVFGLVALLVGLSSRGPVFFVQERVGRFGRPFKLVKFRTMRPISGQSSEWVRDNADRITWVGQWLRRFRLDELPQLLNVLLGDMNLVGPRPHPVTNFSLLMLTARNLSERSGDAIPYYSLRCAVRPGITGWAQIRYGYANSLDEEIEKIRYDLYYLKHMSLGFDLRVLFETVRTMLSGSGSAEADVVPAHEHLDAPVGRVA